jgi:hypothetical protein
MSMIPTPGREEIRARQLEDDIGGQLVQKLGQDPVTKTSEVW